MRVGNLGDCGLVCIRDGRSVWRMPAQQHSFNTPYQLGSERSDRADDCDTYELKVYPGDMLVMGSDGLFDNLFDEDLVGVAWATMKRGKSPTQVAEDLARRAREESLSDRESPFAVAAAENGLDLGGGKLDDVTVCVSYVM